MHLIIAFSANIPDEVARRLINTAGVRIAPEDIPLALAVAVLRKFPDQMRELLLTPDHEPVGFDTETVITTEDSPISLTLVLSSTDKENPLWHQTTTPMPSPASSNPPREKQRKAAPKPERSDVRSKSPSRKPSGKRPMKRSRRRRGG